MKKPIVLTVIDGLGFNDQNKQVDAWSQANTPFLDSLLKDFPNTRLGASGSFVGLPQGQIGNSEVGHLTIGAGQVVYTGLSLINKSLEENNFSQKQNLINAFEEVKKNNTTLHVLGLLSPGGVHSHEKHFFQTIKAAFENGIKNLSVHAIADGRDVSPQSFKTSLAKMEKLLKKYNYSLATIQGRLYAMDRDQNFDKTLEAFDTLCGKAKSSFQNPTTYVEKEYQKNVFDEFISCAINQNLTQEHFLKANDSVIFINFRPDRARQISHFLVNSNVFKQKNDHFVQNIHLTTMMKYEGIENCQVIFEAVDIDNPIGSVIAQNNYKQLRIAETQKYAHVTFFMDGGKEREYPLCDRILIPSIKVDNFAEAPQMSAEKITDKLLKVYKNYDFVIMNYANPDMVGHTGNLQASIKAMEVLDGQLQRLVETINKNNGVVFITADHGNCEIMEDENHNPATKHTTSEVPLIVTDKSVQLQKGSLANVAPTVLHYAKIAIPSNMDHQSLLKKSGQ